MAVNADAKDHIEQQYIEWEEIYECLTLIHSVMKKDKNYEFPEKLLTNKFGKPGRHKLWKNVMISLESVMDQLSFNKDRTWNNFKYWSQRVCTAQENI